MGSYLGFVILFFKFFESGHTLTFAKAVISLQGPCAAQTVKREQYGFAMGFVMMFLSIAYVYSFLRRSRANSLSGLIGTPINGRLLEAFGYLGLSLSSGLAMLVGSVFILFARLKIKTGLLVKA